MWGYAMEIRDPLLQRKFGSIKFSKLMSLIVTAKVWEYQVF